MKHEQSVSEARAALQCRIRAGGHVSEAAVAPWGSLCVRTLPPRNDRPESEVRGLLADQSALIGVVNHLYNLGYPILSVECKSTTSAVA